MTEEYSVSAVITTYKRNWVTIERAIESIRNQSVPVMEILLVDDNYENSAYSNQIKAKMKKNPDIVYLTKNGNFGVSEARNLAIQEAKGNYIAFLDDDDEWMPDKIEIEIDGFKNNPDAALVFGYGKIYNENTGELSDTWQKSCFLENPSFKDMLKHDHVGSTSIPLIKTSVLKELGGFVNQPAVEDYELWIRIVKHFPICGIDQPVYLKHMVEGEHISTNHKNTFIGYQNIYKINKVYYKKEPDARKWILYNIMREGIKAKTPCVIPYCFAWAFLRR